MMAQTRNFATYKKWDDQRIAVRFHQVGHYKKFLRLNDAFKQQFVDREWEPVHNQWLIPLAQSSKFEQFCRKHGLPVKQQLTQLSLF